ncbi:MAG: alpha/beta hydrolase [Verrucomicrobia bacterium]|nr:MAG: alpha/beta hydrolase [Verrucomicrobiota bacterium]
MRKVISNSLSVGLITSLFAVSPSSSQQNDGRAQQRPEPTHAEVSYGPYEQNVFDLWLADSDDPTPLVIYIHGGGFKGGSYKRISPVTILRLNEAGISVASVEYRFISIAKLPAAHYDCRRALQFIRSKAREWNLDENRVGAFGGSAGAQLCMYLGFHDEMAVPDSEDPVARNSTRLTSLATSGGQATMDLEWWVEHIPDYDASHRDRWVYFDMEDEEAFEKTIEEISAISLLTEDDVPLYMEYQMNPDEPVPDDPKEARGWKVHHVNFGIKLKERMDELGIENHLVFPGSPENRYGSKEEFFIQTLANRLPVSDSEKEKDDMGQT